MEHSTGNGRRQAALEEENERLQQSVNDLQHIVDTHNTMNALLREREAFYRAIADFTYDWEYWLTPDGTCSYVSPACERITGYPPDEFLNDPTFLLQIIHTDDRARFQAHLGEERVDGPPSVLLEFRIITRCGKERWIEHACHQVYDDEGKPIGRRASNRDITERKEAEEAYHTLVENSLQGMGIVQDGRTVFSNTAATKITGYSPEEINAMSPQEQNQIVYPDDRAMILQRAQDRQAGKDVPPHYEFRIIHKDGQVRWLEAAAVRITYKGRPASQMTYVDITERKQAEEAYHILVENSLQGMSIMQDGCIVFANSAAAKITGYSLEELYSMATEHQNQIAHPDERDMLMQRALDRQAGKDVPPHYEFRIIRKDGQVRWLETAVVRTNYKGRPASQMTYVDITERKQAEAALQESEARYRTLVENFPDGLVLLFDTDMRYLVAGGGLLANIGMSPDMLEGKTLQEAMPPDAVALGEPLYRAILAGTAPDEVEQHYGGRIYRTQPVSLHNERGEVTAGMIISQDITERKQAEEDLQNSEELLSAIFDNVAVGIAMADEEGQFIKFNQRWLDMIGYAPEELLQLRFTNITHPTDSAHNMRLHDMLLRKESEGYRLEKRYVRKDGSHFWGDLSVTPLYNEQGEVVSTLGVIVDVTEHRRNREALQQVNTQLTYWVNELEQHSHNVNLLNEMGDFIDNCQTPEEAYPIIAHFARQLFPDQSGALYLWQSSGSLQAVARWGEYPPETIAFSPERCWALQHQQSLEGSTDGLHCQCLLNNVTDSSGLPYICVPLVARGERLGVFHLRDTRSNADRIGDYWRRLAMMSAGHIALELSNLQLRVRLQRQAIRDPLTGLFNRRYLDEMLKHELQRADRHDHSVGIIMLDIDHFKRFNDTHGHDGGDTLLREVALFIQNNTRGEDIACRYGGEEFTLILPGASLEDTARRAEQLREAIANIQVRHRGKRLQSVTISLGVSIYPIHGTSDEAVMKAADTALYQAKAAGRDQVVIASSPT
jgi:diguanylate cyclase (GGDEF)-like protein/PAS domain S-box-containing protein